MGVSPGPITRAYSLLEIKAVSEDERVITGIASTPATDRVGDIVESAGAQFTLPIPLLWQHDAKQPIGDVFAAKVTPQGIEIQARIAKIDTPGKLKDRLDEAWQSIQARLVRGLSIGFSGLEVEPIKGTFGVRFLKWLWLELSAVTIPANAEASILSLKSFDVGCPAATGTDAPHSSITPCAKGTPVVRIRPETSMRKTYSEQIKDYEATRAAKAAELDGIQTKVAEEGRTKDQAERESFDTLKAELAQIDAELKDLRELEAANAAQAVAVKASTPAEASAVRGGSLPIIQVRDNTPPGVGFARAAICKMAAYLSQGSVSPLTVAEQRFKHDPRVAQYIKTTVAGGTTTDTNWATELVEPTTLEQEFIEFLRAQTIVGKFGLNGVPALKKLPFNIRIPRQTTGGTGYWVGEGAPKPMTSFQFDAVTLPYTKVAAIAVITQELARFSRPSAEVIVRDQLAEACIARIDTDFVDPAKAVSSGVNPASITNGLTALSSAGVAATNIITDVQNLLEPFLVNKYDVSGLVLIMPNTLALAASLLLTTNGQRQFPDLTMNGGTLMGIPVITSQYAANESSYGNLVIAVDTRSLGLADDGQVSVDVSTEASLQFLDNPTNHVDGTATAMVSLWQTNSIGIRAERFIHWVKLRSGAVVYMDDVNWGSIGSPV